MSTLEKSLRREKGRLKRKNGMRTSGKSVFLTQAILIKKGRKKKK